MKNDFNIGSERCELTKNYRGFTRILLKATVKEKQRKFLHTKERLQQLHENGDHLEDQRIEKRSALFDAVLGIH